MDVDKATQALVDRADIGARLFYSLYHHPLGVSVMKDLLESIAFAKAYSVAQGVFLRNPQAEQRVAEADDPS